MRMIAGLETVTGRRDQNRREDVVGMIPRERDVAMVSELCFVSAHERVGQHVFWSGGCGSFRKNELQRGFIGCEILGIDTCLNENPRSYPGASASGLRWACDCQRAKGLFDGRAACPISTPSSGGNASRDHQAATPPWSHTFYVTHDQVESAQHG